MIPDPEAVAVLCFGDSNTNGQRSEEVRKGRLPPSQRWTGRLQRLLGPQFSVLEEGLGGRTTDLTDPNRPGRDGRAYFGPCLQSHEPLGFVVLMLGTADLKKQYRRGADEIARALDGYFDDLATLLRTDTWPAPAVIVLAPVPIDATRESFEEINGRLYDGVSAENSRELAPELAGVARARGAGFLDAANVAKVGADGIHLAADAHEPLARLVAGEIRRQQSVLRS